MRVQDLERLFDYSYWANGKLLAAMAPVTEAQFVAPVAGSYASIRNTLVHIMSAEWGWLERSGGHTRGAALKADQYPTIESVTNAWTDVERHMRAFLIELSDEDLARRKTFTLDVGPPQEMPLGEMLHHAVIHGVHHRGQVALLLRELGREPGNFDFILYCEEVPELPVA